ncbi:hypothetical protein KC926_00585 [Candidatus Kaiserbacteria bacterium]|nr:hypothetical protein [Candidatus Kaiserbacteria bacterium]
MILALFTASTVSTVSLPETAYGRIAMNEEGASVVREVASIKNTEAVVRSYFADIPVMIEVSRCESTFRHELEDGSVLQGRVDPADTGVMQINKRYHEATAVAMELDLEDLYDNMAYARYLYERQGTQPWSASMPCWGNTLAANF